ncbi:MAG: tRNA (adenosine(37)-N6)-threonylcarbamoyltransferase complex ATPase subunit type 1 TsaE [Pseudomonadota bacterium]
MTLFLADEAATQAFARRFADALPQDINGWTVLLEGELGAGKSTFARAFLHALGHSGTVPSPTYTLVEPYQVPRGDVFHADLYRIASADELRYLGWSDFARGCRLIEWPDRVPGVADGADIRLQLDYRDAGRTARLTALSSRAADVVAQLDDSPNT